MSDVEHIFVSCTADAGLKLVQANQIYVCVKSPFSLWANTFAPKEEKDPMSDYQQLIFDRGRDFEKKAIENLFPGMRHLSYKDEEEGFKLLLHEMRSGTESLAGLPVFFLPEGLKGKFDVIEKVPGSSVFGDYHYVVKEIKSAKNMKQHHILQAAFYNYLLGKIQGTTPEQFFLINGEEETFSFNFADYKKELFGYIDLARGILSGKKKVDASFGGADWPWESFCDQLAIRNEDITLVTGISSRRRALFVNAGLKTFRDLAGSTIEQLTSLKGIGDATALKLLNNGKALDRNEPIIVNKSLLQFPESTCEIFFDLEGTDNDEDREGLSQIDYLIGCTVRENNTEYFKPFLAHENSAEAERKMWEGFIDFIEERPSCILYHFGDYEKTHLKKLHNLYKYKEDVYERAEKSLINLHRISRNAVAFPTYGAGLKEIAKYLGFKWRHKEVTATETIAFFLEYAAEKSEGNKEKLQLILDYNEDDCTATLVIKDWLQEAAN